MTFEAVPSKRRLAATIGKNTIFGIVASAAQIGTRLFTIPVIIHYLGLGGYGIWSIIMVTAQYMRFGSAGIKSAFQKYVAEATGTGDFDTANKLVSTGSITMLIISVICLIPSIFFSQTIARMAHVPPQFLRSAAASIAVLTLTYAISNFGAAYEAIVMGGHRIDLTRKFNTVLTICEAVAILLVLHAGYGLLAMTLVMAISELIYIWCCYLVSHQVAPRMRVSISNFTTSVYGELIRFAGSYQLVNILELLYLAVLPVVILRFFGAEAAGMLALAGRLVMSALIAQDALVLPILSGGTMVFASQSAERIGNFLAKSFKVTFAAAVPPLAFVCAFGPRIIYSWTGETAPQFRVAIWLIALAALLKAVSLLQLVLYRASGKALLDNVRQVLRILVILTVAALARHLGFYGVLVGLVLAELVGVVFMFFAMATTFQAFSARIVTHDAVKISAATAIVIVAGGAAGMIPIGWSATERVMTTIKLAEIGFGCLVVAWPAMIITKAISSAERRTLVEAIVPGRRKLLPTHE